MIAGISIKGAKLLCISSSTNKVPDIGAEKAPARPALAPELINIFSSLVSLRINFDTTFPLAAPNCIDGPSLPKDRPPIAASEPPKNFDIIIFFSSILKSPSISPCT